MSWISRFCLLAIVLSAGCAGRPHAPVVAPRPSAIDTSPLVRRGCYSCLETAFAIASDTGSRHAAFEAAVLLVARSKELGLSPERWIEQVRRWLPDGPDWTMYSDIAAELPGDPLGGDPDEVQSGSLLRRSMREKIAGWRQDLTAGAGSPLLRAYLDVSLACGSRASDREDAIESALEQFPDVPLMVYRAGLCGLQEPPALTAIREADPEFVEVDLPIARFALDVTQQPDQEDALHRFAQLRAAFPSSPLFTASIGDLHQDREEWVDALAAYDATLALAPTHREALLGRVVSLSNLGRHEEAIASATRMVDLGSWLMGAAHFWRAWNEYHLDAIEAARADIDRAKTLMVNAPTYVLSGMIEVREKRVETGEAEFVEALKIDAGQCEAAALLGTVRAETRRWTQALSAFQQAQQCFDLTVRLRRDLIERITKGPGSETGKAWLVAVQQRAMAEAERHRNDAAQSAAEIQKRLGPSSQ